MLNRIASLGVRRVLVALALIVGHATAVAVAASPRCAVAHGEPESPVEAGQTRGDQPTHADRSEAARSAPVPHDHVPNTPAAVGSAACGLVMIAGAVSDVAAPAVEQVTRAVPTEHSAPSSLAPPPPYQPPRA